MLRQLYLIFLLFCLTFTLTWAEDSGKKVKGRVCDENKQPIIGANVYWEGTQNGTTSDVDGNFELERKGDSKNLVVSYIGYMTEVTPVDEKDDAMQIILKGEIALDEVVVSERKMGTIASRTSVLQTQKITYDEICRAACCNLAESFETNPSVDVSYSDAATGARQIKLLGLAGTYVQMLTENYPNFGGPLPYMAWIMFRELGWKVFRCLKEPLRLRMGMRRWPDKSTWNSRSPLRRIFSLLMCSLVMPGVMKGMRMLLGISTTSSLPVYWYTTRMIKCNMTVMTMVFSIRR